MAPKSSQITAESISTENSIASMDKVNRMINKGEISPNNLMVASLDVKSLYTNIDTKTAGLIAKKKVINSKLHVEGVDYKWQPNTYL